MNHVGEHIRGVTDDGSQPADPYHQRAPHRAEGSEPLVFRHARRRLLTSRWAPWGLLAVSLVLHVLVTLVGADPFKMVDLRVYVEGAEHLRDGRLYDFVSGTLHLPFTYPPFSALIFEPLSWLPWTVTRTLWECAMLAALPALIYLTLRLLGRTGPAAVRPVDPLRGILVVGTALAVWLEPVRTNFNYGQINLFLAVLVLGGAVSVKDWLAGAGVGVAAGIKLIPTVTGLFYLLQRRFAAVVWSVVVFAATVAVMLAVIPRETTRYFTRLIFDPGRTGPVFSAINQSWRGSLTRLAGHDVSTAWIVAGVVTVGIGLWAARASIRAGDRTAALLSTQFIGLLVSPISWSHHWIWVLPLLVWGLFGPRSDERPVQVVVAVWAAACFTYLVPILITVQGKAPINSRPGWQSWLGATYSLLGLATLMVLTVVAQRAMGRRTAGQQVSA